MPVQVRNLNLNLIKLTQTRVSSFVNHLDQTNNKSSDEKILRGHCTALSVRRDDHFSQMAPATEPLVELLYCTPVQTQTIAQPKCDPRDPRPLLDPYWDQGSLPSPSLPLPPVLNHRSLRSTVYNSAAHIPDFNNSFAKLVNSTSPNVFIVKDVDCVADFSLSPLRDETKSSFPLWENTPGFAAADPVMDALDTTCVKSWPLCPTWSWSDSGPEKSQSVFYSCEEPKTSELTCSSEPEPGKPAPEAKGDGPSEDQLVKVKERILEVVPVFFKKPHDYRMYHQNLVFINNFWGKELVHKGLPVYMLELSKARVLSHLKFAHLQMNVVKITIHPEFGSIRVHWRVSGLPQLKTLQFWKFLPWTYRKSLKSESQFFDGLSTLFIGCDELIYKHKVDRLMPDEEPMRGKSPDLALKLGLLFGLLPRTGF